MPVCKARSTTSFILSVKNIPGSGRLVRHWFDNQPAAGWPP
ncbi:hypothetical protein SAMN04488003_11175 [Loktanella fryxellensis]|uniref:Uncharacterized protein n=1 Tax=Loktanella fryxellensis TaxID=245187 RepID=A0A1H8ERF0_9RHOB|nr:hypothetical protein SAMN04488003_11175 [Loktanella fryxellensis]